MPDGRLYLGTRRYSSWSMRGWLLVRLAGLDVEEVVIPLAAGDAGGTPAVAAVSPSGLVPFLEHRGVQVWETLAICEYCAELSPGLWPAGLAARTRARAISAEMHAGFRALRTAMPMVLGPTAPGARQTPAALADIARIEAIWRGTRAGFGAGGPFLFGQDFNAADAMFAPVVTRLLTYSSARRSRHAELLRRRARPSPRGRLVRRRRRRAAGMAAGERRARRREPMTVFKSQVAATRPLTPGLCACVGGRQRLAAPAGAGGDSAAAAGAPNAALSPVTPAAIHPDSRIGALSLRAGFGAAIQGPQVQSWPLLDRRAARAARNDGSGQGWGPSPSGRFFVLPGLGLVEARAYMPGQRPTA